MLLLVFLQGCSSSPRRHHAARVRSLPGDMETLCQLAAAIVKETDRGERMAELLATRFAAHGPSKGGGREFRSLAEADPARRYEMLRLGVVARERRLARWQCPPLARITPHLPSAPHTGPVATSKMSPDRWGVEVPGLGGFRVPERGTMTSRAGQVSYSYGVSPPELATALVKLSRRNGWNTVREITRGGGIHLRVTENGKPIHITVTGCAFRASAAISK